MNKEEVRELLLKDYQIGTPVYLEKISRGNSSFSWRADTDRGSYILRKVRSPLTANDEYAISEALWGTGITAALIQTALDLPYAVGEDGFYDLQERLGGKPVTKVNEDNVRRMAKTAALMHRYLREADIHVHLNDRFSLADKLNEDRFNKLYVWKHGQTLFREIKELLDLESEKTQAIHGDLGIWNLLEDGMEIHIIDFGECRMGNAYFDYAALLVSILEARKETDPAILMNSFLKGLQEGGIKADLIQLRKAAHLWILRGMAAAFEFEDHEWLIRDMQKTYDTIETLMRSF